VRSGGALVNLNSATPPLTYGGCVTYILKSGGQPHEERLCVFRRRAFLSDQGFVGVEISLCGAS
jgi:hypothetical protein